jgi:hypothetical protein
MSIEQIPGGNRDNPGDPAVVQALAIEAGMGTASNESLANMFIFFRPESIDPETWAALPESTRTLYGLTELLTKVDNNTKAAIQFIQERLSVEQRRQLIAQFQDSATQALSALKTPFINLFSHRERHGVGVRAYRVVLLLLSTLMFTSCFAPFPESITVQQARDYCNKNAGPFRQCNITDDELRLYFVQPINDRIGIPGNEGINNWPELKKAAEEQYEDYKKAKAAEAAKSSLGVSQTADTMRGADPVDANPISDEEQTAVAATSEAYSGTSGSSTGQTTSGDPTSGGASTGPTDSYSYGSRGGSSFPGEEDFVGDNPYGDPQVWVPLNQNPGSPVASSSGSSAAETGAGATTGPEVSATVEASENQYYQVRNLHEFEAALRRGETHIQITGKITYNGIYSINVRDRNILGGTFGGAIVLNVNPNTVFNGSTFTENSGMNALAGCPVLQNVYATIGAGSETEPLSCSNLGTLPDGHPRISLMASRK